jgi:hypothetical protein
MQENVGVLLKATMQKFRRGGMPCCQNWFEAGHVLAELGDEMHWIHWFSSWS